MLTIAWAIGRIHNDLPLTEQMLSRTKPNLLDLIIALAGGAAGAYATVSPSIAVGMIGVAIATALVPPLATCGICLARGDVHLAAGAFILFLTNLVAIQCASSVVMFAHGYHKVTQRNPEDRRFFVRLAIDAASLIVLTVFLFFQLRSNVLERQFEDAVNGGLEEGLRAIPGAHLVDTRFRALPHANVVVAVVHAPNSITPKQTATIEKLLPRADGRKTELHVRSLLTKETTSQGYMHVINPTAPPIDAPSADVPSGEGSPVDQTSPTSPTGPTGPIDPSAPNSPNDATGNR